ncbi:unnamed protein product [Mycena citricolor]|uniref:Ubiquitin carboxyl-terminal hydrolase n=1 Tax=Mycena citricolor TaxID=2018698 RepID=A0AAD2GV46_9AGAR|nr:unnamed protein product [Mycena citricolor]
MAKGKWPFGPSAPASLETAQPEPLAIVSADTKKFGLENFGNTCYANSVIQALYFCGPFRDLLIQANDSSAIEDSPQAPPTPAPGSLAPVRRKIDRPADNGVVLHPPLPTIPANPPSLFSALRSLYVHISTNPLEKGTVAPRAFIDKLKEFNELFRSTMHQDAHEFLNYLLNKIVEEIEEEKRAGDNGAGIPDDLSNSAATLSTNNSGTAPHNATLVHKLFEGVLTSETKCLTCENVSSRDESFLDLSIDIEQNASVTACLRQFSASEMLCQRNKFFCDVCCDLQEAEKRMKIKKSPNVLALHLKRFKYQEDLGKHVKLAYRVAFPFELRLFNTVDEIDDADRLFSLFAIVVHIGTGPHHGHYISIIKTSEAWLVFDDENVYPITEADIPKYFGDSNAGSAYVLYYQAVDIDLSELGLQVVPIPVHAGKRYSPPDSSPSVGSNPLLPPGLVEEAELSDTSDPVSNAPPSPDVTPVEEYALSPPPKAKFLAPRRTASVSTRPGTSNGVSDDDPKPFTPPPPPVSVPATPNGKQKEKEKTSRGSWFVKRKSFRLGDKSRGDTTVDDAPPSPIAATVSHASSSTWLSSSDKNSRRPSESGLIDLSRTAQTLSAASTRPKSIGTGHAFKPDESQTTNGYDSGSASSSFIPVTGSTSVFPAMTPIHSPPVIEFPPARKSSLQPLSQPQPLPLSLDAPMHKKSLSSLSKPRAPPPTKSSARPTTAGPILDAPPSSSSRPLPPVPPATDEERTSAASSMADADERTDDAPLELPSSPIALESLAGGNYSTSSTSSNGSAPRRATRKMSLSSPLLGSLGFGRRDKKEPKEKSPSSFYFGSSKA